MHDARVNHRVRQTEVADGLHVFEPRESPYAVKIIHKQVEEYFSSGLLDDIVRPQGGRNITVFDVGSNIGMFALEVARRTQGEANIFCFEPVPATYAVLKKNVTEAIDPATRFRRAGAKVKTMPYGLSDSARTVTFSGGAVSGRPGLFSGPSWKARSTSAKPS